MTSMWGTRFAPPIYTDSFLKGGVNMSKQEIKNEVAPRRPLIELGAWERDVNRMLEDFIGRRPLAPWWPRAIGATTPAIDLYEEKDEVVAKAELPGMEKNDIQVNIS